MLAATRERVGGSIIPMRLGRHTAEEVRPDPAELARTWFSAQARPLPWRAPDVSPWAILVSEVMLQQTPVGRVIPVWTEWLDRWPTPASCAAAPLAELLRVWGRLGYPRRAQRLHAAAGVIVTRHAGLVPAELDALLALPGVGAYTARAVAGFAFGQRHAIVDVNVARVLARVVQGRPLPVAAVGAHDLRAVGALLPADPRHAIQSCAAFMELGATVCSARSPSCTACPLVKVCAWYAAGSPGYDGPPRRGQPWHGTDRQVRGKLLAILREADGSVAESALEHAGAEAEQRTRALRSLVTDGLVAAGPDGSYALPGDSAIR